jgi:hypothetical protein
MALLLRALRPSLPAGRHTVVLESVEAVEAKHGAGYKFLFANDNGIAIRTTGQSLASSNVLGDVVAGLLGRPFAVGEEVDLEEFVGQKFKVHVGDEGIDTIEPVAAEKGGAQ